MKAALFDYDLPRELIAQEPVRPRDHCRLMVIKRHEKTISDRCFNELPEILKEGDVLVFNDSKVIPARIEFEQNGRKMEIFLIRRINASDWLAIGKPGRLLKNGSVFKISKKLSAEILEIKEDGQRVVRFSLQGREFDIELKKRGCTPLPPYIRNSRANDADYQTVYAENKGSVAAPTAGLHFTKRLLNKLKRKGIELLFVTLHVGLGTFLPLKTDNVKDHKMHGELFTMNKITANALNGALREKRRIIAVGTTAVRVLESSFGKKGFKAACGETSIYIYPGYKWKCVDAVLTNFHLPKSTLILLTCSFGGRKLIMKAYQSAIRKKYRFYSFGDAMLIE